MSGLLVGGFVMIGGGGVGSRPLGCWGVFGGSFRRGGVGSVNRCVRGDKPLDRAGVLPKTSICVDFRVALSFWDLGGGVLPPSDPCVVSSGGGRVVACVLRGGLLLVSVGGQRIMSGVRGQHDAGGGGAWFAFWGGGCWGGGPGGAS